MREYYEENADRYAAHYGKAAAEKRVPGCTPPDYDIEAVIPLYAEARRLTNETGVQHHVDHAIPLVLGGQHVASNLRVVTAEENQAKGQIERQLVAAATGADPIERVKVVWRDIRDNLAELVGYELAAQIYMVAMEVATETARSYRRDA
ncbi:MAG TPA: HNH endonuclease signature motif containing protein [Longimicrobiales bacterium]